MDKREAILEITRVNTKANIQLLNKDYVVTFLATGEFDCSNSAKILNIIFEYAGEDFPKIETIEQHDNLLFLVLKPSEE